MEIQPIRGSSMIVKMTRSLIEEGWSFISNDMDIVVRAEHPATGEVVSFNSIGNLKRWLYEKALK